MNTKRLYKLVKLIGYTKSEIKELHINNKITVNDKIVSLSSIVSNKDIIKIDGNIISWPSYKYYLYNKPVGIESVISNKINSYINNISPKKCDINKKIF